jgi:polyisoprenoid-binding protein YceI
MEPPSEQEVRRFSLLRAAAISILFVNALVIGGMGPGARAAEPSALLVEIDPDVSRIGIAVRFSMGSFKGVLEKFDARIQIATGDKSTRAAELDFDFADLKTGNKRRDKDMLKWMDYENHPKGSFRLEDLAAQGEQLEARGTVTIHGVSKPIAFPVTIAVEGEHVTAEGSAKLNFLDFDLKPIRKMLFITVKPEMIIDFHLEGRY